MQPISPVCPNLADLPLTTYAKNQPEYLPLPSYRTEDGTVVTRWRLSLRERLAVLFRGSIWLTILTFNRPLQPVMLDAHCPVRKDKSC